MFFRHVCTMHAILPGIQQWCLISGLSWCHSVYSLGKLLSLFLFIYFFKFWLVDSIDSNCPVTVVKVCEKAMMFSNVIIKLLHLRTCVFSFFFEKCILYFLVLLACCSLYLAVGRFSGVLQVF